MHLYRTLTAAFAVVGLLATVPWLGPGFHTALAKTDAAENTAGIQRNLSSFGRWSLENLGLGPSPALRLDDFAGSWMHHGFGMAFRPDGRGYARFRVYQFCEDAQPGEVCDNPNGGPIIGGGQAIVTLTRVNGRTAYGMVSESNVETLMPNGPISLTEYDDGIGLLLPGAGAPPASPFSPRDGITLCGPRYADAPEWVQLQRPCGA